jgi:hypothetical protein
MSRLDRHVAVVQGKLTLSKLLTALAWSLLIYGVMVWVTILANKLFGLRLPRVSVFFFSGLGVSVAAAVAYALWHRPTRHEAAVAIDEKLQLKEKFSTALYVRPSSDPFAAAAVRDAEHTADNVSLYKQFPLKFPKPAIATVIVAVLALLTTRLEAMDLFGVQQRKAIAAEQERTRVDTEREIKRALARIEEAPPKVKDDEQIKVAKAELTNMLARPIKDTSRARSTALQALKDVDSLRQKIAETKNFAEAQNAAKNWRNNVKQPADDSGPVGKAHASLAKGEFTEAIDQLAEAVNKFDQMNKAEQDKAAKQMQNLASQLKQMADNPKPQQLEKKLQDMGANKQQAAQMAKMMQAAANGDKLAQQQLQQMANQVMQNMNNGNGPNQQQQKQIQQMMQQMQGQVNQQQQAAAMAQAAQQMAQAMGQQAKAAGGQGKPGNAQGQAGGQMAQAQGQMQQMLQQMQAQNQAAQAAAAAQGMAQGQGNNGGNQPGGKGGQVQWGNNNGKWGPGMPQGRGAGMGGPGIGAGGKAEVTAAPFGVVQEVSPGTVDDKGKIQHTSLVKAAALKGESKQLLSQVRESEMKEMTDEVDTERIPRAAMKAVKEYFGDGTEDAPETAAPAPAPAKK